MINAPVPRKRRFTTRVRLLLGVFCVLLSFQLIHGLINMWLVTQQMDEDAHQTVTGLAITLASVIQHESNERLGDLIILRQHSVFRGADRASQRQTLDMLIQSSPDNLWAGLLDSTGALSAESGAAALMVRATPWIPQALERDELLAIAMDDRESSQAVLIISAVSITDEAGRRVGTLISISRCDRHLALRNTLAQMSGPQLEVLIADAEGQMVSAPPALRGHTLDLEALTAGGSQATWPDGTFIAALKPITLGEAGAGSWKLVARWPTFDLVASAVQLRQKMLGFDLLLAALMVALLWGWFIKMLRPLTQITSAATAISAGHIDMDLPLVRGIDEVEQLALALHQLLAKQREQAVELYNLNRTLTKIVAERTVNVTRIYQETDQMRRELQALLNATSEAVLFVSDNNLIQAVNTPLMELADWGRDKLSGRHIQTIEPQIDRMFAGKETMETLLGGEEPQRRLIRQVWPAQRELELSSQPVRNNQQVLGRVALLRDVTEQRRIERLKDQFISMVSHELRTPLTSIMGSLGLMVSGITGQLPEKAQQLLTMAWKNSDRLLQLINDLLDVERLATGKLTLTLVPVELCDLVRQTIEQNQAFADQYKVRVDLVEAEQGLVVQADASRLMQVLLNLISNAVKFSPEGGSVTVTLARTDAQASVSVTDRGPGIPEDFRDQIFERFTQADSSTTRTKGGSGLGLHIARHLMDAMNGTITFDTATDVGTTFTITLPASPPSPGAPRHPLH